MNSSQTFQLNGDTIAYNAAVTLVQDVITTHHPSQGSGQSLAAGIAVAVNEHVIPRSRWQEHHIQPGDRVEIIHALMGG